MNPFFTTPTIIIVILLAAYIGGCDPDEEEAEVIPGVSFVSANPSPGDIGPNNTITVTFDNIPTDVKVTAGTVQIGKTIIAGKTLTINGPFEPGALSLTITWTDGTQTLNYTVASPQLDTFPDTGDTAIGVVVYISPSLVESPAPGEPAWFEH